MERRYYAPGAPAVHVQQHAEPAPHHLVQHAHPAQHQLEDRETRRSAAYSQIFGRPAAQTAPGQPYSNHAQPSLPPQFQQHGAAYYNNGHAQVQQQQYYQQQHYSQQQQQQSQQYPAQQQDYLGQQPPSPRFSSYDHQQQAYYQQHYGQYRPASPNAVASSSQSPPQLPLLGLQGHDDFLVPLSGDTDTMASPPPPPSRVGPAQGLGTGYKTPTYADFPAEPMMPPARRSPPHSSTHTSPEQGLHVAAYPYSANASPRSIPSPPLGGSSPRSSEGALSLYGPGGGSDRSSGYAGWEAEDHQQLLLQQQGMDPRWVAAAYGPPRDSPGPAYGDARQTPVRSNSGSTAYGAAGLDSRRNSGESDVSYHRYQSSPYLGGGQASRSSTLPSPGPIYSSTLQSRRSSDSVRTSQQQQYEYQERANSFSSLERPDMQRMRQPSSGFGGPFAGGATSAGGGSGSGEHAHLSRRTPIVYPALLSRVADAFKTRMLVGERLKDGLMYADAFDGREAVDTIAYIIKTTDRNLALLLGRALDAQKWFHDVTYDHRLRDSPVELYQFRERLANPFISAEDPSSPVDGSGGHSFHVGGGGSGNGGRRKSTSGTMLSDDSSHPSGVFTLLTDCYSPTCTRDRLCYSIACPRRLEQQARLNLKPKPGLQRSISSESLGDIREPGSLWIHNVPPEAAEGLTDMEKRRQEAINEVISTERDFVRDIEYLRDSWIKPLRASNIIPESRKEDFITQVFWNALEIHAVNTRLCEQLNKRQKSAYVVEQIGDILLELVPHFGPFVKYGAHQLYGKYEFEKEKSSNPAFAKFVDETERMPESRKLELNGYLTKPTTRLARYPLLLEACLKHTPDDHPEKTVLPKVVTLVREFLDKVNIETGKSENRFNLAQLDQQLVFRPGEAVDLRLRDEDRELIHKGPMKKRGGTQSESAELQVFLFDHALLMVKQKSKNEQYKVYRKPIPLELLVVSAIDDSSIGRAAATRPKSLMTRNSNAKYLTNPLPGDKNNKQGFALSFIHLGRRGYQITLWLPSWASRKNWLEKIEGRQNGLRERSLVFETLPISEGYFVGTNRVTCASPFDNGNRIVYGTDNGVYLADLRDKKKVPVKVISVANVTQLDVLEEQGILIVLADKAVQTFYVDNLDPSDAIGAAKRARKISSHATFFKAGQCLGRTLVCVVKSGSVSSTIKTLEPVDSARGKKQPAIRKFLQGGNESLRVFKEFYIPTESSSIHFLKSKLCVGCTKGFEIVDLETLDTQGLLDPADSSLDFVQKRENAKPISIYRVDGDFLLLYDDFAFYVNKNGWRAKSNWLIQWEGHPTAFALHYPYVLAFEPTFVEVRHVESGALVQIIPGNNLRCLFAETPPSTSAASSYYHQGKYYDQASSRASIYSTGRTMPPRTEIIVGDGGRIASLQLLY